MKYSTFSPIIVDGFDGQLNLRYFPTSFSSFVGSCFSSRDCKREQYQCFLNKMLTKFRESKNSPVKGFAS